MSEWREAGGGGGWTYFCLCDRGLDASYMEANGNQNVDLNSQLGTIVATHPHLQLKQILSPPHPHRSILWCTRAWASRGSASHVFLVNYTNPTLVNSMDMTLEDISKLRQHHDIVEFFTDCLLGSNSPKTVPAPMWHPPRAKITPSWRGIYPGYVSTDRGNSQWQQVRDHAAYCLHLPNLVKASWLWELAGGIKPIRNGKIFWVNNN